MKGVIISTANNIESIEVKENGSPLYELVRGVIGGYMENVISGRLGREYLMVVNESGRLMNLPVNPIASYLYGYIEHGEPIAGNVIILKNGFYKEEPDIVGIPDDEAEELIAKITKMIAFERSIF